MSYSMRKGKLVIMGSQVFNEPAYQVVITISGEIFTSIDWMKFLRALNLISHSTCMVNSTIVKEHSKNELFVPCEFCKALYSGLGAEKLVLPKWSFIAGCCLGGGLSPRVLALN